MEFNSNDFSNYDVNAFDFDGEPGRHPNYASLGQSFTVNTVKTWPLTTTPLAMVVAGFGDLLCEKEGCNYLRAENFEVMAANPAHAFEEIRWQQPTLILINENYHLLQQLQRDPLTRQIAVIMLTKDVVASRQTENVLYARNFYELAKAIEFFQKSWRAQDQKQRSAYLLRQTNKNEHYEVTISQKFLRDPELRYLVAEIIQDWTTLQVVACFGEDIGAAINVEQLMDNWGLSLIEANQIIKKLACAGLIEPLELDLDIPDPLYAVVAHLEQVQLLQKFAQALKYKLYRVALTTYLLGRSR